jgi:hypothetical protein
VGPGSRTEFLTSEVFGDTCLDTAAPDPEGTAGFDAFLRRLLPSSRWSGRPSSTAEISGSRCLRIRPAGAFHKA